MGDSVRWQKIYQELMSTERQYVSDMKMTLEMFFTGVKEKKLLEKSEITALFSNLPALVPINNILLSDMEKSVGDAFVDNAPKLKQYAVYCSSQYNTKQRIDAFEEKYPEFKKFLQQCARQPACRGMLLPDFLIKPLQRICKYPLLIKGLLEVTPVNSPERQKLVAAYSAICSVIDIINERTGTIENLRKLKDLDAMIENSSTMNLMKVDRSIIKTGTAVLVRLLGRPPIHLHLLTDMLLITKVKDRKDNKDVHTLLHKLRLLLPPPRDSNQQPTPLILFEKGGTELCCQLAHSDKIVETIEFATKEDKQDWVREIDQAVRKLKAKEKDKEKEPPKVEMEPMKREGIVKPSSASALNVSTVTRPRELARSASSVMPKDPAIKAVVTHARSRSDIRYSQIIKKLPETPKRVPTMKLPANQWRQATQPRSQRSRMDFTISKGSSLTLGQSPSGSPAPSPSGTPKSTRASSPEEPSEPTQGPTSSKLRLDQIDWGAAAVKKEEAGEEEEEEADNEQNSDEEAPENSDQVLHLQSQIAELKERLALSDNLRNYYASRYEEIIPLYQECHEQNEVLKLEVEDWRRKYEELVANKNENENPPATSEAPDTRFENLEQVMEEQIAMDHTGLSKSGRLYLEFDSMDNEAPDYADLDLVPAIYVPEFPPNNINATDEADLDVTNRRSRFGGVFTPLEFELESPRRHSQRWNFVFETLSDTV